MEVEHYSGRLCLRINRESLLGGETSTNVIQKVKENCTKSNLKILDLNLDRANQVTKFY